MNSVPHAGPGPAHSANWLDRFLFEGVDARIVPFLRIAMAVLLSIVTLVWWRDATLWFTEEGALTAEMAQHLNYRVHWSLFFWLPGTSLVVNVCLSLLMLNCLLLLLGIASRFQMACIFVWLVSFQHRNPLICDAEDSVFRWFALLMIFLPLDAGWSVGRRWTTGRWRGDYRPGSAWALRLIQLQMCLIYASAAWNKLWGETWQDGTALYYVSHMQDHFGRMPWTVTMYDWIWLVQFQTWSALAIEAFLPIALWVPSLRRWALAGGFALHLGIELTMHLFLFQWIMMLGLASFIRLPPKANSVLANSGQANPDSRR